VTPSATCECGSEEQTVDHVILHQGYILWVRVRLQQKRKHGYRYRTRLIRLIRYFAEFLSFVYISVRLIHQFAQFITSFYHLEAFYSVNTSFAVSPLMSKELVSAGIQIN